MLKEIYEQPRAVRDTSQGRVSLDNGKVYLDEMDISDEDLLAVSSIKIAACGTSWHAGLAGKYMIEQLARVPVEVDYASEFRYRDPVLSKTDLIIVISQSGETADTIAAMREAKQAGCKILAICNVQGSMITREANGTILTHGGSDTVDCWPAIVVSTCSTDQADRARTPSSIGPLCWVQTFRSVVSGRRPQGPERTRPNPSLRP